jgi:hypothetical protein
MGIPSVFLGINVHHFPDRKIIFINQSSYITKLLEKYDMGKVFAKVTPCAPTIKLEPVESGEEFTTKPYRSLVGELLYLSVCTRPDIAYAVGILSKFLDKAGEVHWEAALRVLAYLKGTSTHGLPLGGKKPTSLVSYVDADYANDSVDFKSITGYLTFFGDSLISWSSKKQKTVTLSTTEAEFIALTDVAKEILWIQPIYSFLGFTDIKSATIILEDNMPVINLALNQQTKGRTKHLNVKVRFISELIDERIFRIEKVSSAENIADQMTKPQGKILFLRQRQAYMVELRTLTNHS